MYTEEAETVREGIKAEKGEGTAVALAQAAEEADVEIYLIEQKTDIGNDTIRVWTGYDAGPESEHTIESKPVPGAVHEQIAEWGYEAAINHDPTGKYDQHLYIR